LFYVSLFCVLYTQAIMKHRYRVYLCGGPRCSAQGSATLQQHLDFAVWEQDLDTAVEIIVSGCQDRCDQGPNMTVWPGPHRYAGLTRPAITRIVAQHLRDGTPVEDLLIENQELRTKNRE
jgi:(2Fe-2S) ferredoxin